jgi:bifunctional enzyme CysN/CysC/sulfate adenylyltransferase subunit 1
VKAIDTYEGELRSASAPMSIALRLAHAVDVSRGDSIAAADHPPDVRTAIEATAVWLSERPLDAGRAYLLKHASRSVPARVEAVRWRLDPETLTELPAQQLDLNDIGRIAVRCGRPIVCDAYAADRTLGAFILVDALSNDTVAAGTIVAVEGAARPEPRGDHDAAVSADERRRRLGHGGAAVLVERDLEDDAAAVAAAVERVLFERGYSTAAAGTAEGILSCAAAGLIAVCASGGPPLARARLRAELRASGIPLVELRAGGGHSPVEHALAEVAQVAPLLRPAVAVSAAGSLPSSDR